MATNNFFGYTSHGEAGTYPGQAAGYPSVTSQLSVPQTAAQAAAAAASAAAAAAVQPQPAYHAAARFPYPSLYQPVQAAAAAAAAATGQPAASFVGGGQQAPPPGPPHAGTIPTVAGHLSGQTAQQASAVMSSIAAAMPTTYSGYPTANIQTGQTIQPAVTVHQAVHQAVTGQQAVAAGQAAQAAAATAAAAYYANPRTVAGATAFAAGPHFQARPLYSAQAAGGPPNPAGSVTPHQVPVTGHQVGAATPTVISSMASASMQTAAAAAAARHSHTSAAPTAYTPYTPAVTHTPTAPSYTYPAPLTAKPPGTAPAIYQQPSMPVTSSALSTTGIYHHPSTGGIPTVVHPGHHPRLQTATKLVSAGAKSQFLKSRPPPKPQQLHYCEVCKISCAGPQTYKEHLEGQKHRKKEAASKATKETDQKGPSMIPKVGGMGGTNLRCELCDVTCTGSDAYAAHIRGAKHQKVEKLHVRLGKPIPSVDPVVMRNAVKEDNAKVITGSTATAAVVSAGKNTQAKNNLKNSDLLEMEEIVVEPVGGDYIEEVKGENGKIVSFNCKLCDCKFNDPNAKIMHMKGRKHRLQYKKKVDPELRVDVKPSMRKMAKMSGYNSANNSNDFEGIHSSKHKFKANEEFWKRREEEFRAIEEEEKCYWEERGPPGGIPGMGPLDPGLGPPCGPPHTGFGPPHGYHGHHGGPMGPQYLMRPETIDDRHVGAKHRDIYPTEEDLSFIQKHVSHVEKALKLVSDLMVVQQQHLQLKDGGDGSKSGSTGGGKSEPVLKGVMRVGVLAKGLLLKGDHQVELVVLCGQRPTHSILDFVANNLPAKLPGGTEGMQIQKEQLPNCQVKYNVEKLSEEAALLVKVNGDQLCVRVSVTSPLCRDVPSAMSPVDAGESALLSRDRCLRALANLRHAKWFQARAARQGQSCIVVIRVLRDLCRTVPCLAGLTTFTVELLVEKVLASAPVPLSPGDAIRRVFEAIAGGILLPDSPGLLDPCEREPRDAAENLSCQERESITSFAQTCLRRIAFRNIHQVLKMDAIPPPRSISVSHIPALNPPSHRNYGNYGSGARKRRINDTDTGGPQPVKKEKVKQEAA